MNKNNFKFYFEKQKLIDFIDEQLELSIFEDCEYNEGVLDAIKNVYELGKDEYANVAGKFNKAKTAVQWAGKMGFKEKFLVDLIEKIKKDAPDINFEKEKSSKTFVTEVVNVITAQNMKLFFKTIKQLQDEYKKEYSRMLAKTGTQNEREATQNTIQLFAKKAGIDLRAIDRGTIEMAIEIILEKNDEFAKDVSNFIIDGQSKNQDSTEATPDLNMTASKVELVGQVKEYIKSDLSKNRRINGQMMVFLQNVKNFLKDAKDEATALRVLRQANKNIGIFMARNTQKEAPKTPK